MDISYYIDKIIEHRQLIRKYDEAIKQARALVKRFIKEGNEDGVRFWSVMIRKYQGWRKTSYKLINVYLDRIEEVRANDK